MREWFSLDGIWCDDIGIAMLGYTTQPIPEQEVESIQVPGMHGAYDVFTGAYKQRRIIIRCAMLSRDEIDLARKLNRMRRWSSGKKQLRLWDREGIVYDAHLSETSEMDNQAIWGEFELVFLCDPCGQGVERVYPLGLPFTGGGNTETPCVISLSLTDASNGIAVSHRKGTLKIYGSISPWQTIVIDGIRRYVTVGGVDAMPRLAIDSDWPVAVPGPNIITATANASGNVRFSERWI